MSRPRSLHSATPSVSFGRVGQVIQTYPLHLGVAHLTHLILCCAGMTMATAGAPIGAGARWWGVVSSFLGCSALAGGEKSGTEFDQSVAAHPVGRPVGQRAAREAVAQSPQGEVVAEVPSTPRRYCNQFIKAYHYLPGVQSKSLEPLKFSESSKRQWFFRGWRWG